MKTGSAATANRALVCAFTFSPDRNGVANAARLQANLLQRMGFDVQVLTCTPGPAEVPGPLGPIAVHRIVLGTNPRRSPGGTKDLLTVERVLQMGPWDVTLLHAWQNRLSNAVLALHDLSQWSRRTVMVSHGLSTRANYHRPPLNYVNRLSWLPYERWQLPRQMASIDDLVLLSDRLDDDRFFDAKLSARFDVRKHVIANAAQFDASDLRCPTLDVELKQKTPRGFLLSVGNYSFAKNEMFVLEAYAASDDHDIPLLFVGQRENQYSAGLKRLAEKLGLRHVHILHGLKKSEIDWLYAHATLVLAGSRTECQPLVLLDALAAGVPFISTDVGCVRDFAGGVVVDTPREMAIQLNELLGSSSRREAMARAGKAMAQASYSVAVHESRWQALFGPCN